MRKITIIAAAIAAAIATGATSCSEGDIEAAMPEIQSQAQESENSATSPRKTITLTAGGEFSDSQIKKTAYASATCHSIIWKDGDNFGVFPNGKKEGSQFTASSISSDGKTCTLTGECDEADGYFAIYPYISNATYENGQFSNLEIPATQRVAGEDQFDPSADIMAAYTSSASNSLVFRHIGSKLGITVPIANVSSIEITCSENIAGTASVKLGADPDAIPAIESVSNASKTITLKPPVRVSTFTQNKTYYACILPTTGTSDLKIKFIIGGKTSKVNRINKFCQSPIAAMERAKCCKAAPAEANITNIYTALTIFSNVSITSPNAIIFDKLTDETTQNLELVPTDKPGISIYKDADNNYYFLSEKEIYFEGSLRQLFKDFPQLEGVKLNNINTENADISGLFYPKTQLNLNNQLVTYYSFITNIDLSGLDTKNATNMEEMFYNNGDLQTIIWPKDFSTANVKSMKKMFYNCKSLKSLDLSGFDTQKVTSMTGMFEDCKKLESLDLSKFNTANVSDMSSMFAGCTALSTIKASSNFTVSAVEESENMFSGCEKLPGYDESNPTDKSMAKSTSDGGYLTIE